MPTVGRLRRAVRRQHRSPFAGGYVWTLVRVYADRDYVKVFADSQRKGLEALFQALPDQAAQVGALVIAEDE
jgi:hypothetical protein